MPDTSHDKNIFKTIFPLRELSSVEEAFLQSFLRIFSGEVNAGVIAVLPHTKEPLYIDIYKIVDIGRKHGDIPLENFIITANRPMSMITGILDELPFITLIYDLPDGGYVLSSRKFNGHYVVTFFEAADRKYIESIKRRGSVVALNEKPPD